MKSHYIFSVCFVLLSMTAFAQQEDVDEVWQRWDRNYPEVYLPLVLFEERRYADSVERNPDILPDYYRVDKYRFLGKYLGQTRKMSQGTRQAMQRTIRLLLGKDMELDNICDENEVLFRVGNEEIWMGIQPKILVALQEEATVDDDILLYCLFLNEHTRKNELLLGFLISEFIKQ